MNDFIMEGIRQSNMIWSPVTNNLRLVKDHGLSGLKFVYANSLVAASYLSGIHCRGENVYEREWDALIILDACRYDVYRKINGDCNSLISVASTSAEWMEKTFSDQYSTQVAETGYVTANPYTKDINHSQFSFVDEVWRDGWDEERGTVMPDKLTDRAISAGRNKSCERLIVHYMQPHFPFIGGENRIGRMEQFVDTEENPEHVWDQLKLGNLDPDHVWNEYIKNLEFVMEYVTTFLKNFDGKVAITADHGNSFGEWGIWGHPAYVPTNPLRRVPWDVHHCQDEYSHNPDTVENSEEVAVSVEDRLFQLGYR